MTTIKQREFEVGDYVRRHHDGEKGQVQIVKVLNGYMFCLVLWWTGNDSWIESTEITKVAQDYKSPKELAAIQAAVERQVNGHTS